MKRYPLNGIDYHQMSVLSKYGGHIEYPVLERTTRLDEILIVLMMI